MRSSDPTAYQPKPYEIAGFDLYAERQADGSIRLGSTPSPGMPDDGTYLPEFPEWVEVCGATYTLEFVRENEWAGREKVAAVDPNDLRLRICWGVYV